MRERLERRDPELVPVPLPGAQQEEDAGRGGEEDPPGPPPGPDRGHPSRERRNHAEAVQGPFRREPREEAHREDRPAPGAREVRRVDAREPVAEHDEGASDPGRGDEEGNGEDEFDDDQPAKRPERPGKLQHVEGEALGDREAGGGGDREREGAEGEKGSDGDPEPAPRHHEEGAARPESEEGGADHEEREVVPLDDCEEPRQQDLVAEGGGGKEGHRDEQQEAGSPFLAAHDWQESQPPEETSARR